MLYTAYQAQSDLIAPMRAMSGGHGAAAHRPVARPDRPLDGPQHARDHRDRRALGAHPPAAGVRHRLGRRRGRGGRRPRGGRAPHAVRHAAALRARTRDAVQPRVLLVAPLSGHFATLLRATVRTMLADHDVFITDWHNARDVARRPRAVRPRRVHRPPRRLPARDGARGRTSSRSASRACPALAAAALMAEDGDDAVAAQPDADGRPDRRARQPDDRQRPRRRRARSSGSSAT